ncbi:hypothetical protein [Massilia sp. CF038]|uniref:hypothetical protein n=1 Tax=Massilia sp. CF038 TaxID=1881045 RepID=UPI001160FC02|nr:hypothetical protein [Massilia sp. CF038]
MKSHLFVLLLFCGLTLAPSASAGDCVRAEPEPAFSSAQAGVLKHRFVARSGQEADENLTLANGETVHIRHGGCEYVVTELRIRGIHLFSGVVTPSAAYAKAAQLLRRLHRLADRSGFDLALAAHTLDAAGQRNVPYGESVAVEGDGVEFLQARVQLDSAGRKGKREFLHVSLIRGPL